MNTHTSRPRGHARRLAIGVGVLSLTSLGLSTAANAGGTLPADPPADGTTLYSVDLDSGAATSIGSVGSGLQLVGLAIAPDVGNVYGLTDAGELATFSVDDLTAVTTAPITGLDADDPLVGIDRRPADGSVVGLTGGGVVYTIDPATAAATAVGAAIDPALESASFGFDFNPTVDRIRVGASTGQNLRLNPDTGSIGTNPDTGAPTIDGKLTFADGDPNAGASPKVGRRGVHQLGCRRHPDAALRRRRRHRLAGDPDAAERRDPQHRRLARCRSSRRHVVRHRGER